MSKSAKSRDNIKWKAMGHDDRRISSGNLEQGIPERRRDLRKSTLLTGIYKRVLDQRQTGSITIENLSPRGCGLRILTPHDLQQGDRLRLEFKIDDRFETVIRIHGQLCWVLDDLAGLEFQSPCGVPQILAYYIGSAEAPTGVRRPEGYGSSSQ